MQPVPVPLAPSVIDAAALVKAEAAGEGGAAEMVVNPVFNDDSP